MSGGEGIAAAELAGRPAVWTTAKSVACLIGGAVLLRLLLAAMLGLSVDESYSVAISRQFSLSYFDHPPLHLWLVGAWARLTGSEAPLVLRLPFIALSALSAWLLFGLTSRCYGQRAGFWAVLALTLSPLFTVSTGSWIVPDGPMVCGALACVWLLAGPLLGEGPVPAGRWALAGLCAGLALLSKYLAVFPLLGVGLFLASTPRVRALRRAGPWLGLMIALLSCTPVLVWNAHHGWVSFAFQGGRAAPAHPQLGRALLELAGQLGYLLPWTGVALLLVLLRALRRGPAARADWLFCCLALPAIALFSLIGLWAPVLPHWPAIGWLFAFPLLGDRLARLEVRHAVGLRRIAAGSAAFLLALLAVGATQADSGWLDRLLPAVARSDPTSELWDWGALRAELARRGLPGAGTPIAAVSWIDAGKIDYALGGRVPVLCLSSAPHQFAFMHDPRAFVGRDVLLIANARRRDWRTLVRPYFRRIEPLGRFTLRKPDGPVLTLVLARGIGLRIPSPVRP